ncbi:MAG: hypothetical protein ACYTDX_01350 [Planctomycetota bacterium]
MTGKGPASETWVDPKRVRREAKRVRGNRVWRVETPTGPVIQKLYRRKAPVWQSAFRSLFARFLRSATGVSIRGRWQVERRMLGEWRKAGVDVPRVLDEEHPRLAGDDITIMEFIDGRLFGWVLGGRDRADRAQRDDAIDRVCAAWGGRLAVAAEKGDRRLVQVHGSFMHYVLTDDRVVTFDLEQVYLPRGAVMPVIAREIAMCLRFLAKQGDRDTFRLDLDVIVASFPARPLLEATVTEYRHSPSVLRRLVWAMDRAVRGKERGHRGKYAVIDELKLALDRGGVTAAGSPRNDAVPTGSSA